MKNGIFEQNLRVQGSISNFVRISRMKNILELFDRDFESFYQVRIWALNLAQSAKILKVR